jgi:hypothetical protein
MQHLQGIHTYGEASVARRDEERALAVRLLLESRTFSGGVWSIFIGRKPLTPSSISNMGLIDDIPLSTLMGFTTFVAH